MIYQVHPRAFQDGDNHGIGYLEGVRNRLDYISELGVDAICLSPIFALPCADHGRDVSNYCDVANIFGDRAKFDALLAQAHGHGLKLLLDFMPNHTSNHHPWFLESRSSRDNPKRDWYIWRYAAAGSPPPNNWTSDGGGSAWEFDPATGEYYLHGFSKEQPDLNWRNPELRAAMMNVLRYWFDRGVDGFRMGMLWHCLKAEGLPDNPRNPADVPKRGEKPQTLPRNSTDQPDVHIIAHAFRRLADHYGDRLMIGEAVLPLGGLMDYYGSDDAPGVHLPSNRQLLDVPWEAAALSQAIGDYEAALPPGGWPTWVMGSAKTPLLPTWHGTAQARVAAMLLLTLRGTPMLHQGDELGVGAFHVPADAEVSAVSGNADGGLTRFRDWQTHIVDKQDDDPGSMLLLFRHLLMLRRTHAALSVGAFDLLPADQDVLQYVRREGSDHLLIALNLASNPRRILIPSGVGTAELLLSTHPERSFDCRLAAGEGVILRLKNHC